METQGSFLGNFIPALQSQFNQDRALKLQLVQQLIQSGQYQPTQGGPQPGFGQRFQQKVLGPNLGTPNINVSGQNFQYQSPEVKAAQLQKQMQAYSGFLGQNPPNSVGEQVERDMSIDPKTGDVKLGIKSKPKLPSASLEKVKEKRIEDLFTTVEDNKVKRGSIKQALESATKIDPGVLGRAKRGILKWTDPNNPMFEDWQNVKIVLTDAQLMNTAKTKGAISDREMELFSKAAANDDVASLPAMLPVFKRILKVMDADEKSKKDTFRKLYKEDPDEWFGATEEPKVQGDQSKNNSPNQKIPSFASEAEAEAAGLPVGSIIMINGRKVRVD